MKTPNCACAHLLAALIPLVLCGTGCTLVGLGIGSAADSALPDNTNVESWRLDEVKTGTDVSIVLRDGSIFNGEFTGIVRDSLSDYQARYGEYLAGRTRFSRLPRIGDSVWVVLTTHERRRVEVVAYDYNGIYFSIRPGYHFLVRYTQMDTLNSEGTVWSGNSLSLAVLDEQTPVLGSIVLKGPSVDERRSYPLSDIEQISYKTNKRGALSGALVGAAIDAVVIVAILVSQEEDRPAPRPTGSCPFVYSFDGDRYVFDSETFSGAICPALQRSDWDDLEHLVEINGICSLRIENHLPETQYVDALKVIVVDHPQGSRVIAGSPGVIHTVYEPHGPVEAVDDRGNVVLPLLARADSLSWMSNPVGRDPEDPGSVRDGLTLVFDVPREADSARLILSARNTSWAVELEERLLKLQGTDLDRWYEAMESSPEFRESFVDIVRREAMLCVQVRTGEGWEAVQYLPFPGPYLDKTFVVPLDLRKVHGPTLQVRFEATVGLWTINSVSLDCSPAVQVRTSEARLVHARDSQGKDIGGMLASADGQYYVLEQGDRADLAFTQPPASPGTQRSYILESNGYYRIHMIPTGAPQRQLLSSFTNEPGAFGRYSLTVLNGWLERELGKTRAEVTSGFSEH